MNDMTLTTLPDAVRVEDRVLQARAGSGVGPRVLTIRDAGGRIRAAGRLSAHHQRASTSEGEGGGGEARKRRLILAKPRGLRLSDGRELLCRRERGDRE